MNKDFLSSVMDKMEETEADFKSILESKASNERIQLIDPKNIGDWEYRDRQDFELGDLDELAESIRVKGQAQPIIVVISDDVFKSKHGKHKFIVIAGYRRWLACKEKNMQVEAVIRKLTFEQAVSCLVSENEKVSVSDYSKGMFYYKLLKEKKTSKKSLYEKLGIKKGSFDNYISFAEVPQEIWDAVGDLKNVSARTSATIKLLCQKGESHKAALLKIADKIAEGIGEKRINSLVTNILKSKNENNNKTATRVAYSDSISLHSAKNYLRVNFKDMSPEKIEYLKEKISHHVQELANSINLENI